jgi:hypothetical protein
VNNPAEQVYPVAVDPYDARHLLIAGHQQDNIAQSVDGGETWTAIPMEPGMSGSGGTGKLSFINTGNATATRNTWLWISQNTGGMVGTWRTTNGGSTWSKVENNEHAAGVEQTYQPDNNGVLYMAGAYSALGWGVLRSTDYGQTWTHVGGTNQQTVVYGTQNNVYSELGYSPAGPGSSFSPQFEVAAQPGLGTWTTPPTPLNMDQGPAQAAVVFDGSNYDIITANYLRGLWRYVEPAAAGA